MSASKAPPLTTQPAGTQKKVLGILVALAVLLIVWNLPVRLDAAPKHALAVTACLITLLGTEVLDLGIAGIVGCYLFWITGVAKPAGAFAGFTSDTTWFVLGVLVIGGMTQVSGLGRRIGYMVVARAGSSYTKILLSLIIADFLLTFVVPSGVPRVVILASVAIGLIDAFGVGAKSNIARGMFIICTYSATIFDKMMLANPPALMARGIIESVGHTQVSWFLWFLAYLPCDLITIIVCWRVTLWLYPPEVTELPGGKAFLRGELLRMGSWTIQEKKCAVLILIGTTLWMTDSLHHINPSIIGVGVGLVSLLPGVGFLTFQDFRRVNLSAFFLVGAALSMTGVLAETKALDVITSLMFSWMTPLISNVFNSTLVLYWTAFVYHIFLASEAPMLASSMPPLMNFSLAKGFNPIVVGMIWTFASSAKIFVYQAAAVITGYSYGYFEGRDVLKVGIVLTVFESIMLLLLVPFYWPLIGLK